MKRLALLIVVALLVATPAQAVQKSLIVKKLDKAIAAQSAELLVLSGASIVTISNTDGLNSNIVLSAMDVNGVAQWQKTIDSGVDEVAMSAGVDSAGNIWLAGFSAEKSLIETATAPVVAENPDSVVIEALPPLRSDSNQLTLWKISPVGDVLATYISPQDVPGLISAISINNTGVSIIGQIHESPFLQTMSSTGIFEKVIQIGTSKTTLNAVVRNSDGSTNIFGSSSETLAKKKVAGVRDGILMKVSKAGVITSVVRSSAVKADRSWLSADNSLLLSGYVKTGKVIETAITKFSSTFAPSWTIRIPSNGASAAISNGSSTYAALGSKVEIKYIVGWKPVGNQLLLVAFDSKGQISSAYGSTDLSYPISITYSKELGVVGLAKSSDGLTSIFHLASR